MIAEKDPLKENAPCAMVGKPPPLGTHGPFDLLEDLKLSEQRQQEIPITQFSGVFPPMTQSELEGIIPILVPPYPPLHAWCQVSVDEEKIQMDYRWKRYNIGRERHVPNYNYLLQSVPSVQSAQSAPIQSHSTKKNENQFKSDPINEETKINSTNIPIPIPELLFTKDHNQVDTLQSNIRKKCQLFLFKKGKQKKTKSQTTKRTKKIKEEKRRKIN